MVKKSELSLLFEPETASGHAEDMKPAFSCQDNNGLSVKKKCPTSVASISSAEIKRSGMNSRPSVN